MSCAAAPSRGRGSSHGNVVRRQIDQRPFCGQTMMSSAAPSRWRGAQAACCHYEAWCCALAGCLSRLTTQPGAAHRQEACPDPSTLLHASTGGTTPAGRQNKCGTHMRSHMQVHMACVWRMWNHTNRRHRTWGMAGEFPKHPSTPCCRHALGLSQAHATIGSGKASVQNTCLQALRACVGA